MRHYTSPTSAPTLGGVPIASMVARSITTTSRRNTCKETTVEGHIQTSLYQAQLLHKEFAQPLNVVIIVKTNLRTQAQAHVILFSSDLELA